MPGLIVRLPQTFPWLAPYSEAVGIVMSATDTNPAPVYALPAAAAEDGAFQ